MEKLPKLNLRLILRVLRYIEQRPDRLRQNNWFRRSIGPCGTVGCFAGWTVYLATPNIKRNKARLLRWGAMFDSPIHDLAKRRLRLTESEAKNLFAPNYSSYSDLDVIRERLAAILKERGIDAKAIRS